MNADTITIEDIKSWATGAAMGTETNESLEIDGVNFNDAVLTLKYSPEEGGYIYFANSGDGYNELPLAVREWLESNESEEFTATLY